MSYFASGLAEPIALFASGKQRPYGRLPEVEKAHVEPHRHISCKIKEVSFPAFSGIRCLMMPYVQGDPGSVPVNYSAYRDIIESVFVRRGDIGFITIDESPVKAGKPHRGTRAKCLRAIHTEAGRMPGKVYCWGGGGWGRSHAVTLDRDVEIIIANNLDFSCAIWDAVHEDTSLDGDIGYAADLYPYDEAILMKAGEARKIGILTPHESLPAKSDFKRQFLRIVGSGVHGREDYFTENPMVAHAV